MSSYNELYNILEKGIISLDLLRQLLNEEHVTKIEKRDSDKWQYDRYNVYIDTEEFYVVYVKKPVSELIKNIIKE